MKTKPHVVRAATCERDIESWMAQIDKVTARGKVLKMVIMEADHQDGEFTEVSSLIFNCKPEKDLN